MFHSSKVFYLILLSIFMLPAISANAEEGKQPLFNVDKEKSGEKSSNDKNMKSMSWNIPKPKEEKKAKTEEAVKDSEEAKTDSTKDPTAAEKLWEKYKALAEDNKHNDKDSETEKEKGEKTADTTADNDEKEFAPDENDEKTKEEIIGLKSIIEDYKNSQKSKGIMNSRSFGKID